MNIVVCIKQVPDTETKIKLKSDFSGIETEGIKYIINPYDEFAIEEALRIKDRFGQGVVTLITVGPSRATEALRTGLAMGADEAIHINDPFFEGCDQFITAKALAAAIKNINYDLILCGRQAIDDDSAQVYAYLAEFLDLPFVSFVIKLDISQDKKSLVAHRVIEGGSFEVVESSLPAIIAATKGLNEPRYASLPGIMKAKKKEIKILKASDLGFANGDDGSRESKIKIKKYHYPPERKPGRIIDGEPEACVKELVRLLREEAKVI